MFIVIYRFIVVSDQEAAFRESWAELTQLIYAHKNSLGSRLHSTENAHEFIAYAQWPDKASWEAEGSLEYQELANPWSEKMRASCSHIETLHTMTVVDDLLKHSNF